MTGALTIGEVAAQTGVAAHVLRHWEDVGVLSPTRDANGYRKYDPEHLAQVELVRCGQRSGLSLTQLKVILARRDQESRTVLEAHRATLQHRAAEIHAAMGMINHALQCTASTLTSCPQCCSPAESFGFPVDDDGRPAHSP